MNQSLITQAIPHLICLHCQQSGQFKNGNHILICQACGTQVDYRRGYLDFTPDYSGQSGWAQKAMESSLVVKVYENYVRPTFTSFLTKNEYQKEEAWIRKRKIQSKPAVILDIASGTGRYSRWFNYQFSPKLVISADISIPMLLESIKINEKQGIENILHIRCDAENLPLKNESVDWVNCFGALHLFKNANQAIKEASRVSHSGANFSFLTAAQKEESENPGLLQRQFSRLAEFTFFKLDELRTNLENAGYKVRNIDRDGLAIMVDAIKR